jgi:replicative DNA helicase
MVPDAHARSTESVLVRRKSGVSSWLDRAIVCPRPNQRKGSHVDIERIYLSKVATTGQIENSLSAGITENHFDDEVLRNVYTFMADHTRRYKAPPSMNVLRERFPDHNFEASTDSVEYLRERFVRHVKLRYAKRSLVEMSNQLQNPDVADNIDGIFLGEARRLSQLMPTSRVHKFSEMEDRISRYEKGTDIDMGIKMGIHEFDRLTFGIQPHEFVSIVGWQGTGKSTLTQWMVFNAWMQGKTAMIFSLEMEAPALFRKWDTMLTNFEYRALKAHELSPSDVELWRTKAQMVRDKKCDIIVKDDITSCTPDFVFAETMRYKPDLVAIDYVSLMDTTRSSGTQMWEKVTYLTQQLKQIARTSGTPIIAVAQTNIASADGGAKLENIAYSRSIGQDSDIVLGLHQDDDMKENQKMTVRMLKNRDGSTAVGDLYWNMDNMEFMPWNEKHFFENRLKRQEELIGEHKVDMATGEVLS